MQLSGIRWVLLTREELESIPPETIEQLPASEKKQLFKHLSMSNEERAKYLQEQAQKKKEKKKEKQANLALAEDMTTNPLFKRVQVQAEEATPTSTSRLGNWTETYEFQDMRICLACQKRFQHSGKKGEDPTCPTCKMNDPETIVEWSPALDPTCE